MFPFPVTVATRMIQFLAAGIPTTESSSSLDQPHLATLKHLLSRSGSGLGTESSFSSYCFWFVSISSLVLIQNKISHVFPSGWEWVQLYLQKQIYKNPRNHLYQNKMKKKNIISPIFRAPWTQKKTSQARSAWHQAPPNSLATRWLRTKMAWVSHWRGDKQKKW